MGEDAVRAAFASQSYWGARLGSPFTSLLCKAIGERIDGSNGVCERLLSWRGDPAPEADNLPARVCGAFHFLVRRGEAPSLAALYPPAALPSEETLWAAAAPLFAEREATFESFLDNSPQTNEVGRAAVLMAGLLAIADRFALPLSLFELGSSGGLNLVLDRYAYDLGGLRVGDPDSRLMLAPVWKGPSPPAAAVRIAARRGVDLSPIDPARDGERLLAFVWADQKERIERLESALANAAADPLPIERGEAADWLERVLPDAPREGAVRVVMHSVAFQYFPAATQQRIAALMERIGSGANEASPLAWLRYEQVAGEAKASLRLRAWPGGDRLLAWAHPHGSSVRWLAG